MADFRKVQEMAERQGHILTMFENMKQNILILSNELLESEPKTAKFLEELAEGGFKSVLMHYLLESRSNIVKAGESISLDDIIESVNKESVSKEANIVALKKSPEEPSEPTEKI